MSEFKERDAPMLRINAIMKEDESRKISVVVNRNPLRTQLVRVWRSSRGRSSNNSQNYMAYQCWLACSKILEASYSPITQLSENMFAMERQFMFKCIEKRLELT